MSRAWSVFSAVQESGWHQGQQESPNTASRHQGWGIRLPTPFRDTCYQEWFAQRLLVLFIWVEHLGFMSRDSQINNWSEAHSMGSSNKASSERETKNCDVEQFLSDWMITSSSSISLLAPPLVTSSARSQPLSISLYNHQVMGRPQCHYHYHSNLHIAWQHKIQPWPPATMLYRIRKGHMHTPGAGHCAEFLL